MLQISIAEYNPFTKSYAQTEDYDSRRIELASAYVVVSGLTPGRCLQIDVRAFANSTTLSTTVRFFTPLARVTCGCPSQFLDELASTETTGSPSNLALWQV
jgi:hypothetical protein